MVRLPTTDAVPVPTSTQPVAPRVVPHVLVADGNAESRERRAAQLHASGYRVSVSRTPFETIVKASCQVPDVILLDESFGEAETADTAHLLSTCPTTAHIPVVRLRPGRRLPHGVLGGGARRAAAG